MVRYNDCNCVFRIAVVTIVVILLLLMEGTATAVAANTEIIYDDGSEEGFLSTGDGYVIKMSSPFNEPFTITAVQIFGYRYGRDSWINLDIWDQNKKTISHFTAMQSDYFTYEKKSWANINIDDVVVDGDFYVFFSTDSNDPRDSDTTGVEVGIDSNSQPEISYRAYSSNSVGLSNVLLPTNYGNWMIRAVINGGDSIVETNDNNIIVKKDDIAFEEVSATASQSDTSMIDSMLGETDSEESSSTSDQKSTSLKSSINWIFLFAVLVIVGTVLFVVLKRKGVKEVTTAPITSGGSVDIKRGYEVLPNNNVRFGIRINNISNHTISDVEVILDYSESLFKLEGERLQKVGVIPPAGTRTAEFTLKPLGCIHQVNIEALISYRDIKYDRQKVDMRPKEVHCVCPFLKGKAMLRSEFLELSSSGHSAETGLNFKGVSVEHLTSYLVQTCKSRHHKVDDYSVDGGRILYLASESIGEKAYYLLTALIKEDDGLIQVMLRVASDKPHGLNGFLNEIVAELRHVVSTVQSAQEIGIIKNEQVINIIDSVVQRTSFRDIRQGGSTDVHIEGSVVHRSDIDGGDSNSEI